MVVWDKNFFPCIEFWNFDKIDLSKSVFSMGCRYLVIQRREIGNRTICGEK